MSAAVWAAACLAGAAVGAGFFAMVCAFASGGADAEDEPDSSAQSERSARWSAILGIAALVLAFTAGLQL